MEYKHTELAKEYKNYVVVQLRGMFYHGFDDSAFALGELMGYKVKKLTSGTFRVGFPLGSIDKVIEECQNNQINIVAFDGEKEVKKLSFEKNRFKEFMDQFDMEQVITDKEKKQTVKNVKAEAEIQMKQRTSFIQGQGITLENAIIDAQRTINNFINTDRKLISLTLIENKDSGLRDMVLVQGILIYEIL